MDGEGRAGVTASADRDKASHRRPGSFARIGHDPDAFASFYREHVTAVTRFVARRVADPHTVADLTAEVFLAVIGSAHTYRPGRGTQVAWLYGIARNVIAGERRRAAHELRAASRIAGEHQRCKARDYAGYRPWLPTTTAGMRAYLQTGPQDGSHAQSMIETGFYLLTGVDLTPAQQAAVYRALVRVPGLTVVPKVTDILGRAGVGIRSRPGPGMSWTAIFDPTTFKLLGSDIEPTGPGYVRTAMAVQPAVVNKVGQRP
jgi:hypothetical protein